MKIVEPYAKIINFRNGIDMLNRIEYAGRVSHRSEERQDGDTWERFIRAVVLGHGDWSIVEHEHVTVEFLVDRGITHEIVRHRHFSYTQESTRFVNYSKPQNQPQFIKPEGVNATEDLWADGIDKAEVAYMHMLAENVTPQLARSVLPNALASKLIMTGNLRAWRHFFVMRTTKETHPQMKQVTIPLLKEFQQKIPLLFEDITPEARQVDSMRLPR